MEVYWSLRIFHGRASGDWVAQLRFFSLSAVGINNSEQ